MPRLAFSPVALAAPVRREVGHAVKARRIGNVSADRGLDVLTFFVADVQTGFGPFIAIYLAASGWVSADIGAALGVGALVGILAQVPAGIAIDASPLKRGAALVAMLAVMGCAVLLALFPWRWPVYGAEVLHGVASCMLVPAIAAISISRVGRAALGPRLGRNARFMALGSAIGAFLMGLAGTRIAPSAPLWLTAAFAVPAILALLALPPRHETEPRPARMPARAAAGEARRVLLDRRLFAFAICVVLFHTANSFMLPLATIDLRMHVGDAANLWLAAALIVPQGIVALLSPWVGRLADRIGRRPVLLVGFAALPLRGAALALTGDPYLVIAAQILDGAGGAMFGVLQPLIASDLTRGTNRFNLVLGVLGLSVGVGGTISSVAGGWIATTYGSSTAFAALAATGAAALAAVWLLMPETRDAAGAQGQDPPQPEAQKQEAQKSVQRPL